MPIPDAIYDANGKVAMRYLTPIQKYIMLGNKHEYVFIPRYSVSLAWVDEADVELILSVPKSSCEGCGGSARSNGFILANQASINCHRDGSR